MVNVVPADIVRGRLTKAEREQIAELADRGFTSGRIAQKLNRHPATINQHMVTHGLREVSPILRRPFRRGGVLVVPFQPGEDAFIEALRLQDYSAPKIAGLVMKRFGHQRSAATIGTRLKMLASRETA